MEKQEEEKETKARGKSRKRRKTKGRRESQDKEEKQRRGGRTIKGRKRGKQKRAATNELPSSQKTLLLRQCAVSFTIGPSIEFDVIGAGINVDVVATLRQRVSRSAPVDVPSVVGAELERTGLHGDIVKFPATLGLVVGHRLVCVPSVCRGVTNDADAADERAGGLLRAEVDAHLVVAVLRDGVVGGNHALVGVGALPHFHKRIVYLTGTDMNVCGCHS